LLSVYTLRQRCSIPGMNNLSLVALVVDSQNVILCEVNAPGPLVKGWGK
jgi:hypothetical protein